jgi:GNAT superfamily N-acetyltransferase
MTETQAPPVATTVRFDPHSDIHAGALARLHRDYLMEETARLGYHAPGIPVASWLATFLIQMDDATIGYCSADHTRFSVELIYVAPQWRGHGLASHLLRDLMSTCPQPMKLKAPLSPGGEALARKLGIPVSESTPDEAAEAKLIINELHAAIAQHCTHRRRSGNPGKPCARCYRNVINRSAASTVLAYCRTVRYSNPHHRGTSSKAGCHTPTRA